MTSDTFGIDLSKWQGVTDWRKFARFVTDRGQVPFAYMKATQGLTYTDPTFERNWKGARDAGVLRGAYHYFQPELNPVDQAKHFVFTVGNDFDLPLALDLESDGRQSNAKIIQATLACLKEIEKHTAARPVIYTSAGFWNAHLVSPWWLLRRPPSWTNEYRLWLAHYTMALRPTLPIGFKDWLFWQYSDREHVPGIVGNVDGDRFNGTAAQLKVLARPDTSVQPNAEPLPTGQQVINLFAKAFGPGYWSVVMRVGLADYLVANRKAPYLGPLFSELALSDNEKSKLLAVAGKWWS